MNTTDHGITAKNSNGVAVTLQCRDIKIQIHNDIDKYVFYIILKKLKTNVG